MNKANAKRALQAAIDCIDVNDTESAQSYAACGYASLFNALSGVWGDDSMPIGFRVGEVLLMATPDLVNDVRHGVIDAESPPLFDDGEPKDGSGYSHGDDGPGELREMQRAARALK